MSQPSRPDAATENDAPCPDCDGGWIETAAVQNGEASEQVECATCDATGRVIPPGKGDAQ